MMNQMVMRQSKNLSFRWTKVEGFGWFWGLKDTCMYNHVYTSPKFGDLRRVGVQFKIWPLEVLRWIWVASDARDKSQGHFARQPRYPPQIAAKATIWSPEGRPRCRHYSQSLPTWKLNKPRQVARVTSSTLFLYSSCRQSASCQRMQCGPLRTDLCLLWVLNTSKYAASFVPKRQHPFRMTNHPNISKQTYVHDIRRI